MSLFDNLQQINNSLPPSTSLVAVSKTKPVELVLEAYEAGQRHFGENYIQELVAKQAALPQDIYWHFIGHLQSNKVKYIAPFVHLIHGVDSLKLLKEVNKQAQKVNRTINCLLQIHIAKEETKFGLSEQEVIELLNSPDLTQLNNINILGLMGMASFSTNMELVESEFELLGNLFNQLKTTHNNRYKNINLTDLSMGMSGDYPLAIKHGATLIRVGSSIFGSR